LKVLITGASGLLGSKLAELTTASGHTVYSLYHSHPCKYGKPQRVDITDSTAVRKVFADTTPDVVFHTASITDVDLCETNPELAMKVNGEATSLISKTCQEAGSYLTYVSTDYVFDGLLGKYSEEDKPAPINTYGKSKLFGEKEMARHCSRGCIARTSVVYGWGRLHRANFATWLHENLTANHKISVATDQYASPTLNTNLAGMLIEVAELGVHGILHVAGSTRISRYEFAITLAKHFGLDENLLTPVKADVTKWIAKRPYDSSLNVSKAQEMLANKPATLDKALDEFAAETPGKIWR
jgi:dTDP-4-dehydrorhamnose reductase